MLRLNLRADKAKSCIIFAKYQGVFMLSVFVAIICVMHHDYMRLKGLTIFKNHSNIAVRE